MCNIQDRKITIREYNTGVFSLVLRYLRRQNPDQKKTKPTETPPVSPSLSPSPKNRKMKCLLSELF